MLPVTEICGAFGRVIPHDFADIMMIDDGVAHVVSFHSTMDREIIEADICKVRLPLSTTTNLRRMVETGQPCMVPDTHSCPDWADVPETRWVHSYIGAPIRVTGETIGFINLNSVQPHFLQRSGSGRVGLTPHCVRRIRASESTSSAYLLNLI